MKKFIILFIILCTATVQAQKSGKSKAGRLFSKKKIQQEKVYTKPIISIESPNLIGEKTSVSEKLLIIRGKISDKYGISSATLNNEYLEVFTSGDFYFEIELEQGSNPISIEAVNNQNQKTTKNILVEYIFETTKPPLISLVQPKLTPNNDFTTNIGTTNIIGKVEDLRGGKLEINSQPIDVSVNGDFLYQLNLLNEFNPVTIKATGAQNQKSEIKFNIYKKIESVDPVITIIEPNLPPSNEIKHNETIITIRGRIEDNIDISTIEVNNKGAALLGKNEFFANVNLNDGINNIVVKTTNIKGKRAEKMFRVVTPVDDKGPEIVILEPSVSRGLKIVRKKDVITVKGKVSDRSGILNVKVNNREANLLSNNEFTSKIYLGIGNNTITVSATDNKYNVTIDTFYVTRELEQVIKTGKYIALIMGVNSYDGYWHSLRNAVNDARGLEEVLKNDYHFTEVHTLMDKEATRKNIIKKFEWLVNNISQDDNVLIFYAGHGQFKRELNKGYWVPVDAQSNSTADYISNSDIKTYISGIRSKHTLLITDACFAGDIFRGSRTESIPFDPNNMTKYYREVHNKSSRLALTSGSLELVSDAGKENHSIFTYYLLKSLKENKKKYLDASQLFNDFRMAVVNNSQQTPQLQVVRDANDEGGQFIFIKKD